MSRSAILLGLFSAAAFLPRHEERRFTRHFDLEGCRFTTVGGSEFLPLDPGRHVVLEGIDEGELHRLEVRVTGRIAQVGDVACRVVEEIERVAGEVTQVMECWYAADARTGNVFCFGEQVDEYRDGRIVGHAGSWEAWQGGAEPGLAMPGTILVGARFQRTDAPGVSEDRAEIVEHPEGIRTPAGLFRGCVELEESTPLEPDESETKGYAPNVGLVSDGPLKLVEWSG